MENSKQEWEKWLEPAEEKPPAPPGTVPPPEQRICVYHNRVITEKDWLRGSRNTECSKCKNIRARKKGKRTHNRADGSRRPRSLRLDYKRSMERRKKSFGNGKTLTGIQLFERSTGTKIS